MRQFLNRKSCFCHLKKSGLFSLMTTMMIWWDRSISVIVVAFFQVAEFHALEIVVVWLPCLLLFGCSVLGAFQTMSAPTASQLFCILIDTRNLLSPLYNCIETNESDTRLMLQQ